MFYVKKNIPINFILIFGLADVINYRNNPTTSKKYLVKKTY